jgi:hypothetical protein
LKNKKRDGAMITSDNGARRYGLQITEDEEILGKKKVSISMDVEDQDNLDKKERKRLKRERRANLKPIEKDKVAQ